MVQTIKLLPALWGGGTEVGGTPAFAVFDKVTNVSKPLSPLIWGFAAHDLQGS